MSKKNEKEIIEVNSEEVTDTEQVEEIVEEKKPNKVLSVAKKLAPFAVLGGVIAAAFALGKSSGSNAAYLEMLNDGSIETDGSTEDAGEIPDQEDSSQTE